MKFIILKKRIEAPAIGAHFEDRLDIKSLSDLESLSIGQVINGAEIVGLSIYDFENHVYLTKKQAELRLKWY